MTPYPPTPTSAPAPVLAPASSSHRGVRAALVAVVAGAAVVTAVALLGWRHSLPDVVATHFTGRGIPDGTTGRDAFSWSLIGVAAAMAIVAAIAARWARGALSAVAWVGSSAFVAWVCAGIAVWTVIIHHGVAQWRDVRGPMWPGVVVMIGAALGAAALCVAIGHRLPAKQPTVTHAVGMGLGASELASWSHRQRASWMLLVAAAGVGMIVAGVLTGMALLIAVGAVIAVVGVEISSLRVTVDRRGLSVGWGPLAIPTMRIGLDRVAEAQAADIRPMQWGGWGYRGSLRLFGKAAAVLRAGEGIRVQLRDGKTFAVTVDDADTAARLLNDLTARQRDAS